MIAYLSGQLFRKTTQSVIVDVGGVGYEVVVPLSTFYGLPEKDESVSLHIYTHVKEDTLSLFGFQTKLEKEIFLMLISVTGIGPKLAVNILSGIGPKDLLQAMAAGDSVRLQAIPGVGRKTAERIALELKERAGKIIGEKELPQPSPVEEKDRQLMDDALSALVNLGYSSKHAERAIRKALPGLTDKTLEGLITKALRALA